MEELLKQLRQRAQSVHVAHRVEYNQLIVELETRLKRLQNLKDDLWVREGSLGWSAEMCQGYESACQTISEQLGEIL